MQSVHMSMDAWLWMRAKCAPRYCKETGPSVLNSPRGESSVLSCAPWARLYWGISPGQLRLWYWVRNCFKKLLTILSSPVLGTSAAATQPVVRSTWTDGSVPTSTTLAYPGAAADVCLMLESRRGGRSVGIPVWEGRKMEFGKPERGIHSAMETDETQTNKRWGNLSILVYLGISDLLNEYHKSLYIVFVCGTSGQEQAYCAVVAHHLINSLQEHLFTFCCDSLSSLYPISSCFL